MTGADSVDCGMIAPGGFAATFAGSWVPGVVTEGMKVWTSIVGAMGVSRLCSTGRSFTVWPDWNWGASSWTAGNGVNCPSLGVIWPSEYDGASVGPVVEVDST